MKQLNNRSNKEIQKQKLITEIITNSSYVPRQAAIKSTILEDADFNKYKYGISNKIDPVFIEQTENLNSSKYNDLFKTIIEDLEHIRYEYKEIDNQIEDNYRNYINKINRYVDQLNKLELEVNQQLLLTNSNDAFRFGIVEEFTDLKFIDQQLTNALIYDGLVMCQPEIFKTENTKSFDLSVDAKSRSNSIVFQSGLQNIFDMKILDKTGYQHIVYTNYKNDIVDLIIDIKFNNLEDIDVMRLDLFDTGINSKMIMNVFYMSNSHIFEPIENNNLYLQYGTSFVQINKKQISNIKIVLTKTSYDEAVNLEYLYKFNVNYIGFNTIKFKTQKESTLICGPYQILDGNNPVNFNSATIKGGTCCEIPDKTSIDFYLSKDKVNWEYISFTDQSKSTVNFKHIKPEIVSLINYNDGNYICTDVNYIKDLNLSLNANQSLLNFYIPFEKISNYIPNSTEIKRHTSSSIDSGWVKTQENKYFTTFFIEELEGKYIDFGPTPAIIDNVSKSNKVFLKYGVHTIETNQYILINGNPLNEIELKNYDSLYPYNHKYLIEGYSYINSYTGRRIYLGAKENYGYQLKEVSLNFLKGNPEKFNVFSSIKIPNKGIYFIVNVSLDTNAHSNEAYDINVLSSESVFDNNLYIKAILKTDDKNITPKIDSVQVRVI
ncbi:hypothetical protein UFOVP724_146 [uncultured Caudovirales phage]|uniref:Uncharacterized protein n=1 Tax=uncultured Caudovirales phage TaxID=2100421 RepID=A0A6J5NTD1_9CAUD|nr:hypothetical protein UFOVP724_146 [uncultured Caudovirales phage]